MYSPLKICTGSLLIEAANKKTLLAIDNMYAAGERIATKIKRVMDTISKKAVRMLLIIPK